MKLIISIVSFNTITKNVYTNMKDVLIKSLKNKLKDHELIIKDHELSNINYDDYNIKSIKQPWKTHNTLKLKIWNKDVQEAEDNIILMDSDMLVTDDFTDVFEETFNIGITKRTGYKNIPYNGGIFFIKPTDESKKLFNIFEENNMMLYYNPQLLFEYKRIYAGMNQSAWGYTLENFNTNNKYNIKEFPCSIYNACVEDWENINEETKIIHCKGDIRKIIQQLISRGEVYKHRQKMYLKYKNIIDEWMYYYKPNNGPF